ncbi:MAG: fasciclin domain-containing protein [Nitrososphaerota archaeon]|jgi:uncharacterized surface protein with fasciclin (FAS1) repeats|nr:fasciclin domain-containing protein [Nitrososphaerota archaeon]
MADLADLIMGDVYNLNTFSRALREAGLVDFLKGAGPFTVFAPTDEAFTKLSKSTLDELFANKNRLKAIVNYHIISESLTVEDLRHLKNDTLTTQQGQLAKVDPHRWHLHLTPKINGIHITDRKDVTADNGILHEINAVMMPNFDLTCPACGQGFLNQNDLETHTNTAHKQQPPTPSAPQHTTTTTTTTIEHKIAPAATAAVTATAPAVVAPLIKKTQTKTIPKTTTTTTTTSVAERFNDTLIYEVLYDEDNQTYLYHLKDANGEIIAESLDSKPLETLNNDIKQVKTYAPIAKTISAEPTTTTHLKEETDPIHGPVFEQYKDDENNWRFNLKDTPEGPTILTSRKSYDTLYASNNAIDKIRKIAPNAKTIYPQETNNTHKYTTQTKTQKEEILTHH